jgi:hypothetical protein
MARDGDTELLLASTGAAQSNIADIPLRAKGRVTIAVRPTLARHAPMRSFPFSRPTYDFLRLSHLPQ